MMITVIYLHSTRFRASEIQRVTEISTLILTSNRTRHDEQFFYVPLFPNPQFF
jgi:hypothetical protein